MSSSPLRRALLALPAIALARRASRPRQAQASRRRERLVVRGDATIVDGPVRGRRLPARDDRRRVPRHARQRRLPRRHGRSRVAEAFPNGEGGVCAPIRGRIVLGAGTTDRLVLAVDGDSCQDGAGPVTAASFTGVADVKVVHGTGAYAKARGTALRDDSPRTPPTTTG